MSASFLELIIKKRDGEPLSENDIDSFVKGITERQVEGHQIGAMLMAMYINGLGEEETSYLTKYMMRSGETLEWPDEWRGVVVDKHSTGGVGDKISLVLAPALAVYGLKKCAESLHALLLDVKVGSGAMIHDTEAARTMAKFMYDVGHRLGIKTTAVLSNMDHPIEYKIGNVLEILEALECLRGEAPTATRHLTEGGYLLYNVRKASCPEEGRRMIAKCLEDGTAMTMFCQLLKAQGVSEEDADVLCSNDANVFSVLPKANLQTKIIALNTGFVSSLDALTYTKVSSALGAGRTAAGQPIDHAAGLDLHVAVGSHVKKGEPWVTVHHNKEISHDQIQMLQESLVITSQPLDADGRSIILDIIKAEK